MNRDVLSWGVALVLVAGTLCWCPGLVDFADGAKTAALSAGTLGLLALAAWNWREQGVVEVRGLPFLLALASVVAWAGVAALYAGNRHEAAWVWARWAPCLALAAICSTFASWQQVRVLWAVSIAGGLAAGMGLAQWATGWSPVFQAAPPASTFGNCNCAVEFCVLTAPVSVGLFLRREGLARGIPLASVGLVAAYALVVGSKSGGLALVVCAAIFAVGAASMGAESRRDLLRLALVGLALSSGLLLASPGLRAKLTARIVEVAAPKHGLWSPGHTVGWRVSAWANTAGMVREEPLLGVGLGQWEIRYPEFARYGERWGTADTKYSERMQPKHPHNDLVQWTAETGLVGLALALAAAWLALAAARRTWSRDPMRWGMLAVLASAAVTAQFGFPFYRAATPFALAALVGCQLCREPSWRWRTGRRSGWALVAAAGCLFAVWAAWASGRLIEDRHLRLAREAEARRDWATAERHGLLAGPKGLFHAGRAQVEQGRPKDGAKTTRESLKWHPNYVNAWFNLGVAEAMSGQPWAAEAAYRRALELCPTYNTWNNLGAMLLGHGRLEAADEALSNAVLMRPRNPSAIVNLGLLRAKQGRLDAAEALFREALAINPKLPLYGWIEQIREAREQQKNVRE